MRLYAHMRVVVEHHQATVAMHKFTLGMHVPYIVLAPLRRATEDHHCRSFRLCDQQ